MLEMNRRSVGIILILISTLLLISRYLISAIAANGAVTVALDGAFQTIFTETEPLSKFCIAGLILGVIYLALAEILKEK